MVLLFSLLIVAVTSLALVLTLTLFIQHATGWLLPRHQDIQDNTAQLSSHNPRPYHAQV